MPDLVLHLVDCRHGRRSRAAAVEPPFVPFGQPDSASWGCRSVVRTGQVVVFPDATWWLLGEDRGVPIVNGGWPCGSRGVVSA